VRRSLIGLLARSRAEGLGDGSLLHKFLELFGGLEFDGILGWHFDLSSSGVFGIACQASGSATGRAKRGVGQQVRKALVIKLRLVAHKIKEGN